MRAVFPFRAGTRCRAATERAGPCMDPRGRRALPKSADYFARVFIDDGALTWPNGYDWDPETLQAEMKADGLLRRADAAE